MEVLDGDAAAPIALGVDGTSVRGSGSEPSRRLDTMRTPSLHRVIE